MNVEPKPNGNPVPAAVIGAPTAVTSVAPAGTTPTPAPNSTATPALASPAEPLPNPLAHVPLPFQAVDYTFKGYHLEASVPADQVVSAAEHLDKEGFALDTITGVDWLPAAQMEVIYDYFHPQQFLRVVVRARVPRDNP